jgi:hypothetical protein
MNEANESVEQATTGRGRRKHSLDAHAEPMSQGRGATLPTEPGVPVQYDDTDIVVETVLKSEKAELLAFMEEPVDILVHESTDQNAIKIIPLSVNGAMQPVFRGVVTKVRRKYVALLASLKSTTYSQQTMQDVQGNVVQKMIPHTALRFPFSVAYDPNPKGVDWLRTVLNR